MEEAAARGEVTAAPKNHGGGAVKKSAK